jgi:hypothetical protein
VEKAFAPMDEVDVKDKGAGLVDDFPEEAKFHEPLFLFLKVFIGAHDAAKIADAGGLNPEANREIGKTDLFSFVAGEDLEKSLAVLKPFHGG